MTVAHYFEISDGYFGIALVNEAAVGWTDAWQSPAGDTGDGIATSAILADLADYSMPSSGWSATGWSCQITTAAVVPRAATRTITRKPTWCEPGTSTPAGDESSYSVDLDFYQDTDLRDSLVLWLFENDASKAYVYMGMNQDAPPTCVGVIRVQAATIGGAGNTEGLETGRISLPFTRKPLIERVAA